MPMQVREYHPPSEGSELSAAQVDALKRDVDAKRAALDEWCKTAYGEVGAGSCVHAHMHMCTRAPGAVGGEGGGVCVRRGCCEDTERLGPGARRAQVGGSLPRWRRWADCVRRMAGLAMEARQLGLEEPRYASCRAHGGVMRQPQQANLRSSWCSCSRQSGAAARVHNGGCCS